MNPILYTTLEQSKLLKNLGIVQGKSECLWAKDECHNETDFRIVPTTAPGISYQGYEKRWTNPGHNGCIEGYAAFTVGELGLMFGEGTKATEWLRNAVVNPGSITYIWKAHLLAAFLVEWIEMKQEIANNINARYLKALNNQ